LVVYPLFFNPRTPPHLVIFNHLKPPFVWPTALFFFTFLLQQVYRFAPFVPPSSCGLSSAHDPLRRRPLLGPLVGGPRAWIFSSFFRCFFPLLDPGWFSNEDPTPPGPFVFSCDFFRGRFPTSCWLFLVFHHGECS